MTAKSLKPIIRILLSYTGPFGISSLVAPLINLDISYDKISVGDRYSYDNRASSL